LALAVALLAAGALGAACSSSSPPLQHDGSAGQTGADAGRDLPADLGNDTPVDRPSDLSTGADLTQLKSEGSPCASGPECASTFCFDAVCCRKDCSASCWSCASQGSVGICIPADVGTDPRDDCPDDGIASCGRDGTCDGSGSCRRYPTGTVCKDQSCVGATKTLASRCDTGVCKPKSGLTCDPYACNADGTDCLVVCTTNNDCDVGNVCVNGSCGKKPLGAPCGGPDDCNSTICQQGICCSQLCTGTCMSCAVPQSEGSCSPIPAGSDPLGQCADNGAPSCGTDGTCDGSGGCRKYVSGTSCTSPICTGSTGTLAGRCDGVGTCAPGGALSCGLYACGAAGACLTKCASDADCATGNVCNGTICGKKVLGTTCASGSECDSTFCQQGVCCNQACAGTCQSCNLTNKGTCTAVPAGQDPLAQCAATDPTTCGTTGTCDGAGKCAFTPGGTVCQMPTCTGSTQTLAERCDGAGHCGTATTQGCDPYECGTGGSCLSICSADKDCTVGTCIAMSCGKKPLGAPCAAGTECGLGFCAQGVCCSSACTQTCMSCALAGSAGSCTNIIQGQLPVTASQCVPSGVAQCGKDGTCDGNGGCHLLSAGTQCVAATCAGATFTSARSCDGSGTCLSSTSAFCPGGYTCDTTNNVCKITCTADTDCVAPLVCNGGVCSKKPLGRACGAGSECALGFCQQGVCCSSACTGSCKSCALPGANLGTCSNVAAGGADPAALCQATATSTCGQDGTCNGSGACRLYAATTQCAAPSCSGSRRTPARLCDGAGTCQTVTTSQCDPFECDTNGSCKTTCTPATSTTDCVAPNVCTGTSCGKKPNGVACAAGTECNSAFCQQGVCCLTACTGLCQSCALAGSSLGTCSAVPAGGADPQGGCANQGTASCGTDGTCNGSGACRQYSSGTVCVAATCSTGATLTSARTCNGSGTCQAATNAACAGGFECDTTNKICKTSCTIATQAADCAAPNVCTGTICGVLKVQYLAKNPAATVNTIAPWFQLVNLGTAAVPLSQLTIRYWYTADGNQGQTAVIDFASNSANQPIQADVTGTFTAVSRTGADFYVQFAFSAAAGNLNGNNGIAVVQPRVFASGFPNYTQTGDYSFDASKTAFTDWTHVTLYNNGVLVWGIEP
jgi:hypothetical protein